MLDFLRFHPRWSSLTPVFPAFVTTPNKKYFIVDISLQKRKKSTLSGREEVSKFAF